MATGWIASSLNSHIASFPYVQLHTGAPGAAGTANTSATSSRVQTTWGALTGGVASNAGSLTWASMAATEVITHFSAWTLSSGGSCGFTGTVTNGSVSVGDSGTFAIGALTLTVPVAS